MININKKRLILVGLVILFICLIYYVLTRGSQELSEDDINQISKVTNSYYKALEKGKYDLALSLVEINKDEKVKTISYDARVNSLKYLFENIYESFKLETPCSSDKVWFDESSKKISAYIVLEVRYKKTKGRSMNEVLTYKKVNSKWKIDSIKSSDVFVSFRTDGYNSKLLDEMFLPYIESK